MDIKGTVSWVALLVGIAGASAATTTPVTTVVITNDTVLARDYYATTFTVRGDNIDVSLGGHTLYGTSEGQGAGKDKPAPLSVAFNIEGKNTTIRNGKIRQYKNGISVVSGLDFPSRKIAVEKWEQSVGEARTYLETFYSKGSDGATLLNLDIEAYQICVYVNPYVQNFRLLDSRIKADWIGIYLDTGVRHSTIQGNLFRDCGWNRYRYPKTPNLYFSRPQKRGKGREAIAVDGAHENLVCGNTFTNSNLAAITFYSNCMEHIDEPRSYPRIPGASFNRIVGNTFEDEEKAIWIASRQLRDLSKWGAGKPYIDGKYVMDDAKSNRVEANTFRNTRIAVEIADDGNRVEGNTLNGASIVVSRKSDGSLPENITMPQRGSLQNKE